MHRTSKYEYFLFLAPLLLLAAVVIDFFVVFCTL